MISYGDFWVLAHCSSVFHNVITCNLNIVYVSVVLCLSKLWIVFHLCINLGKAIGKHIWLDIPWAITKTKQTPSSVCLRQKTPRFHCSFGFRTEYRLIETQCKLHKTFDIDGFGGQAFTVVLHLLNEPHGTIHIVMLGWLARQTNALSIWWYESVHI